MSITIDATKGWARPASSAEVIELFAGSGVPTPAHYFRCDEGSGNLANKFGGFSLNANGTPLYGQAAAGWAGTGVAADDNTTDGFVAAAGSGPNPATTSQVWAFVIALSAEPAANRLIGGMNIGGAATTTATMRFAPSGATNRLSIIANANANGTLDHPAGDYVLTIMHDIAGARAKVYSAIQTVTGVISSAMADGNKGLFRASALGGAVCFGVYVWEGVDAEGLDDADIATIRSRIEAPPAASAKGHYYRRLLAMGGA